MKKKINVKCFLLLKYLHICPDIFGYVGEWFDKKATVNSKIYDVTDWTTNNYNPQIVQYLRN